MGEGDPLSLWLSDVDGTASGDDAGCALSKGEGVLLSFWLCDVDGTASDDDAGCAFICNNKNIIINNEIINYYMYVEVHQYTYIIVLFNSLHGVVDVLIILDVSLNHKFYVIQ